MSKVWGIDEVGIGPMAGIACVALYGAPEGFSVEGLTDSKKLTEKRREAMYDLLFESGEAIIEVVSLEEIEEYNIQGAIHRAMKRAVERASETPEIVYVDGNIAPDLGVPVEAIVKGDQKVSAISAASVVAKVFRDRHMYEMEEKYPGYGFAKHKGYPTKFHKERLNELGPCPIHRRGYEPVARLLRG